MPEPEYGLARPASRFAEVEVRGRIVPLVAAAALCVALGCRRPPAPDVVRVGHESDVLSLDSAALLDSATTSILSNIFEGLAALDGDMRLVPALARSWTNPDERTWVVHLRPGVRFHDGSLLTGEDVASAIRRGQTLPGSGVKGQLFSVADVQVVDPLTVELTTTRPDPLLMSRLAHILVPSRLSTPARPVGTGPYRFVRWDKGRLLETEAFPDYWGGRPPIGRVFFIPADQEAQSLEMLRQGGLDIRRDLPETLAAEVGTLPGIRIVTRPGLASDYLWFDSRPRPGAPNPFADRRVRQAVSLAMDRQRLAAALGGSAVPAEQFVQRVVFGHVAGLPALAYDPARARTLLAEAGLAGTIEVTLAHNSGTPAATTARVVQTMLAEVGIRVTLQALEWSEMVAALQARRLPFFLSGWRFENGDATGFLRDCLYTRTPGRDSGAYNPGFSSPELDRLIDEGDQILGETRRAAQYDRVMRLIMAEMPLVPLHHRVNVYAVSKRLRFEPRLDGKLLAREMSWAER